MPTVGWVALFNPTNPNTAGGSPATHPQRAAACPRHPVDPFYSTSSGSREQVAGRRDGPPLPKQYIISTI
jgi:hypothetical protein